MVGVRPKVGALVTLGDLFDKKPARQLSLGHWGHYGRGAGRSGVTEASAAISNILRRCAAAQG